MDSVAAMGTVSPSKEMPLDRWGHILRNSHPLLFVPKEHHVKPEQTHALCAKKVDKSPPCSSYLFTPESLHDEVVGRSALCYVTDPGIGIG